MTNEDFIKSISLEGEIWKDVVGTKSCFAVSNFGRICSLSHPTKGGNNAYFTKQHIISQSTNKGGYLRVRFCLNNGVNMTKLVHRLVAEAFIPNPNNYPFIDHIDGNPANNNAENLRWCTRSMNMLNPITRERNSNARKNKPAPNRRGIVQLKDGKLISTYNSLKEACDKYGLSSGNLSAYCKKLKGTYRGYTWMYLSDYEVLTNKSKNDLPNPN